jgi:hypothetical protein
MDDDFRCQDCGGFDSYGTITDRLCGYCKEQRRKRGETMETKNTQNVCEQLEKAGYDHAVAVATQAEIEAGAACGQLSIIGEEIKK